MSRWKKLLTVLVVLLLFFGDYLYWTISQPLDSCLPEAVYGSVKAELIGHDSFFTPRTIEVETNMVTDILDALKQTVVTRRPKFVSMSEPFFYLYLYYPDGYIRMTVVENGNISVVPDMRSDRQVYFDGGEELYHALLQLAEK